MAEYTPEKNELLVAEASAFAGSSHLGKSQWRELDKAIGLIRRMADALAAHDAEVRASVVPEEPDWEYRINDGKLIAYSRSKSRADRALAKGARVWRRTPERRASAWLPVEQEKE